MFKNVNLFRAIVAVLILFIPLYPKFPLANISETYVAIRLDDIVVALAVLIFFIYQLKNKFPVFKIKVTRYFLLYFLAIIVSNVTAYLIFQTVPRNLLLLHLFRRFEYMSLFFVALYGIKTSKDLKYPYITLIIATILVSAYGLGQKYLSFPVISTMNSEFSKGQLLQMNVWTRISSTFAGHYDLASFMSVVLVIIAGVALLTKNIFLKIINWSVWLLAFYILTSTASRTSLFAFWAGITLTLILLKKYLPIIPITLLVVFSIVSSKDLNQRLLATIPALKNQLAFLSGPTAVPTPPIALAPTLTPTPVPQISPAVTPGKPIPTIIHHGPTEEYIPIDADVGVARSGEIRFNVEWPRAITALKTNLVTGTGLGSITLATDNDYLRALGESGLLGFITFLGIFAYFFRETLPLLFKKNKNRYEQLIIILFGAVLVQFGNAVFIDIFEASKTAYLFWIMMAVYYQLLQFRHQQ
ncbi:MAG TPA: hypothetical protein VF828_04045 [Patescibacteria group bacterium]